jgi:hypothetical protein
MMKELEGRGCPICHEEERFEELDFLGRIQHVEQHRPWQRIMLWLRTRVLLSELLYARMHPKHSYLTPQARLNELSKDNGK